MKKPREYQHCGMTVYEDGLLWKIKNKVGPPPEILSGAYTGIKLAMDDIDKFFAEKEAKIRYDREKHHPKNKDKESVNA